MLDLSDMNETGFQIGCGKAQLVDAIDQSKTLRMIYPENGNYILPARLRACFY